MTGLLAGERIGVLGLARSGLAAARLALAHGASVYASDSAATPALHEAATTVRALGGEAEVGGHDVRRLTACDRIILSPGIPPDAAITRAPEIARVPVVSEIEFAWKLLDAPVIAVTGTNGKSTVTALISHLLAWAGRTAPAGGNIGVALSALALRDPPPELAVVEISSFQLATCYEFAPEIGVVTNLAPDHLDWYPDAEAYYADKARLFQNAEPDDRWVLNGEDARVRDLAGDAPGARFYFRISGPLKLGELGGFRSPSGQLVLRIEAEHDETLIHADELRILGPHNVANALAASVAACLAGGDLTAIADGLRSFRALPHRLEPICECDGVLWINDSKATNVASTRVAVQSMDRPTILLLGGHHKGERYSDLAAEIQRRVRRVLAFGEAGERVAADLHGSVEVERVNGRFEDVVERARTLARPGDAVLLSPACSSFDMFTNYEERGRRFAELAKGATE